MRSIVRAAAYLPVGSSGVVRVAASDEDSFTLGATAVERTWLDRDVVAEPLVIHLLGEFPLMADWGFPVLVGRGAAEVVRRSGDAPELVGVLRALEEEGEGPALVVAAELPERAAGAAGSVPSPFGAAAVAFLLESSGKARLSRFEATGGDRSAVALALRMGKKGLDGLRANAILGDWDAAPASGRRVDVERVLRTAGRDTSAVSEGAYVPRARYLENLPSRWRFAADECDACHEVTFPARDVCRRCRRHDSLTSVSLPRDNGRVVAVTMIGKGGQPTEFDAQVEASGPYQVALVEVANGIRITLQVTDAAAGEVRVGDSVNTLLRRLYPMEGEWRYGRKAVPAPAGTTERGER